jgi:uncharacterized protein (TIGR02594 family)
MSAPWVDEGRKLIGLAEIKGAHHAPQILKMWGDIKRSGIKDDETPWCAAFVGAMLERVGIVSSRFESAKSYLTWGAQLAAPCEGCIVVFSRDGGGHVGFVIGQSVGGDLLVLGGNQADAVNIRAFPRSRVTGYRWPIGWPVPAASLPILRAAEISTRES